MSESITVHLRGQFSFDDLCRCLEQTLGHQLSNGNDVEWDVFRTTCLGLGFSVYESRDFDDDCGLAFTAFAFVVSIDCLSDSIEHEHAVALQEMAGRVVARSCCICLQCECMVVRNLQHLVESYGNARSS